MLSTVSCICAAFIIMGMPFGEPSAIPIWENLNKHEKMTYLYKMFENQVGEFCQENNNLDNCHTELLKYGLGRLRGMPEDHLDKMDPYERNANDKIWGSMMEGHAMMKPVRGQNSASTTAKPNSYEDDSFGEFGSASARYENVVRVAPPAGFIFHMDSGSPQYVYPPRQYSNAAIKAAQKGAYSRFQEWYPSPAPLDGPMVVKVHPDGRPVQNGGLKMVADDDLVHYQLVRSKIPNF